MLFCGVGAQAARHLIGHVQIAAVPSRHEPDEGEIHYPAIFEMLDRIGYRNWGACEYRPHGKTEQGLGWAQSFGIQVDQSRYS